MAVELASGYVSVVPSAKGFGSALDKQIGPDLDKASRNAGTRAGDEFTTSFGGSLSRLATIAAGAFATIQVGSFFKGAIESASDLNETVSKVGVVLGKDVLPQVEAFADGAATSLGQSKQAALDAAATFGVFGKSAGLTGKPLADFSTNLVQLAGDMASFSNTTPEDAIDALSSALRGEQEPIRRYGVLLDDATLRTRALKLGIISTTKDALTPQQRVLAAQAEIMAQTADAQGDFARTSGGLANQQRILTAQLANARAELGKAFLPAAIKVVTFLNQEAIPAVKAAADAFRKGFGGATDAEGFAGAVERVGAAVKVVVDFLSQDAVGGVRAFVKAFQDGGDDITSSGFNGAMERAGQLLRDLVKFAEDHADAFKPIAAGLGAMAASLLLLNKASAGLSALQSLGGLLPLLGSPIGVAALAIGGLAAAAVLAYKKLPLFRDAVDKVAETFKNSGFSAAVDEAGVQLGRLWDVIKPKLAEFLQKTQAWLKANGPVILGALGAGLAAVGQTLTATVLPAFGNWITQTAAPFLRDKFKELAPAVGQWIQETAVPFLQERLPIIIDSIIAFLRENEPKVLAELNTLGDRFFDWVTETALPALREKLPPILAALFEWAQENLPKWGEQLALLALDALGRLAVTFIERIPDLLVTIPAQFLLLGAAIVAAIFGKITEDLPASFKNFTDSLLGFLRGLPGEIAAAADGMWDGLYDAFRSAVNLIIRAWNGLEFTLPSVDVPFFGKVGGFTLGTPDIPELAKGGVFTQDFTGLLRLAETPAARPEIVTPQRLMAETFRKELASVGGGRGGVTIEHMDIREQQSASRVVDEINQRLGWMLTTRAER